MDDDTMMTFVMWAPYAVGVITLLLAICIKYLSTKLRLTFLSILGLIAFLPFEVTRKLTGVEEIGEHLLFFYLLGIAKKVSFTVILLHLTTLFPHRLSGFFFVIVAVLLLTPFLMPVDQVAPTYTLGDVIALCLSMGSTNEIPTWFLRAWQFHTVSFSVTALSSFLVWENFFYKAKKHTISSYKVPSI